MINTKKSACSPPPYTSSAEDGALSPMPKQHPIPADVKPANFIQIYTADSVRGVWTIDPGLVLPVSLMSPSPNQEDRKNVLIESQGSDVNVDVFVLLSPQLEQSKISMKLDSWGGSACVRVHDAEPQNVSYTRIPMDIVVNASMKKADIYIPRSFKGPLQLVTGKMGKVFYSKAVKAQITPISSMNGTHSCFIGEYRLSDWKNDGMSWPGDELKVNAKDAINLYYDDEGDIPTKDTSEGGCTIM